MEKIIIRSASEQDAAALLDIYSHYVLETAVSFEYEAPDIAEFAGRIRAVQRRYPWLVAECGGEILGYAYAAPFKARPAYDWDVETTIYLRRDQRRRGLGRMLYSALEDALRGQGVLNACACIAVPADEHDPRLSFDSIRFHERMGYRMVGQFRSSGYKLGRWYDMAWMEKPLAEPPAVPVPLRPYREIEA